MKVTVPFIEGLEIMTPEAFCNAMKQNASDGKVDKVNWPEGYPYCPECSFKIARSAEYLALKFFVRGMDLRSTQSSDNGRSWEDSCCEFFISPDGKTYYNVEVTCTGSVLMARGDSRNGREQLPLPEVARVLRRSNLPLKRYELAGGDYAWSLDILIPFSIIGLNPSNLPVSVRGNFYKCGDLTAHPHYLSWSPVTTPSPDFHRPEFFGVLEFV